MASSSSFINELPSVVDSTDYRAYCPGPIALVISEKKVGLNVVKSGSMPIVRFFP